MSIATEKQSIEERWVLLAKQLENERDPKNIIDLARELTAELDRRLDLKVA